MPKPESQNRDNSKRSLSTATAKNTLFMDAPVRYIKLGAGGKWEKECFERGIIRFGYGTEKSERFPICAAGKWDKLKQSFIAEGKDQGTAARFTKEARLFFEDAGSTLWITFDAEKLHWGFLTAAVPQIHDDGDGVWRSVKGKWR
jgi:hypothetical protein